MTHLSLAPFLVVCALYAIVGPTALALTLAALALLSLIVPRSLGWSRGAQIVVSLALFVVAVIAVASFFPQPSGAVLELRTPWRAVAGAALVVGVTRFHLARPAGGEPVALMLELIALTACGGTFRSDLYPAFVVAFIASAAAARRAADEGRAPLDEALRSRAPALAALVAVTVTIVAAAALVLPKVHRWTVAQLMQRATASTGFSDRMWLGALSGMLASDERVMRVRGEADGALLRGIVFDQYSGARWSRTERFTTVEPPSTPSPASIEIEMIAAEPERYFLPLGSSAVAVSSGIARVDAAGVVAPIAADPARHVWYRPAVPERAPSFPVGKPTAADRAVPAAIARELRPFALAFAADRASVAAKLSAIEAALKERNHYSLDVPWSGREDPVVAFVRERRGGHCEYFASAMALLARTLDIPARVVGGYRVTEKNPIGGYYLVRERDAHAWVEAWIPGRGWVTYDPTPASALVDRSRTHLLGSLWDFAGSQWAAFLDWLNRRTPLEMVVPPIALIGLALGLRRRRRRSSASADQAAAYFLDLCRVLSKRGLDRRPHESPSALGRRAVAALAPDVALPLAEWLERYAALRYGGHGDEAELERQAGELARRIRG